MQRLPTWLFFLWLLLMGASVDAQGDPAKRRGGAQWGAGYFPDVTLTTQHGDTVRFFEDLLKDKVVVINFIYTTCPDVCPLETARLAELQAILGDRVGRDVFLYSITIDPENDTPEVLADYARRFGAGPGWLFLTGDEDDIVLLRKKLSLYRPEIQKEGSNDHNLSLIIGNQRTGRWMKRSPMENPYFLADQVGGWLCNWKTPSANMASYADAPELRKLSTGENLFRTRCWSCHVIGDGDEVPPHLNGRLLGPDLLGVTERRDRDWLARWLAEPDKMLAEKDPTAMELFARHSRIAMPNFSLNEGDVNALIDFLEVESRRVETRRELEGNVDAATERRAASGEPLACCQKNAAPVLTAREDGEPVLEESAPPPAVTADRSKGTRGFSAASVVSGGLGCILFLLALAFGKPVARREH